MTHTDPMPHLSEIGRRDDVALAYRIGRDDGRRDPWTAAGPFRFPNCPEWCNDHSLSVHLETEWMYSAHRHVVQGDGWTVELEEDVEEGGVKFFPRAYDDGLTLEQTRAYLAAVQSACDVAEGRTAAS